MSSQHPPGATIVSSESRYWLDLGQRALALGWVWGVGMFAIDDEAADLLGGYEVELVDGMLVARRVRDGSVVAVDQGSLVPYLNDEGITAGALHDRVSHLLGREAYVVHGIVSAPGSVTATSMGWTSQGAAGRYATRAEALLAAGEAARARLEASWRS